MPNVHINYAEGSCCQMCCPNKEEVTAASAHWPYIITVIPPALSPLRTQR